MTLFEMSFAYQDSAEAIRRRIAELQVQVRTEEDPEASFRLRRRIDELTPLWKEARDLAALTAHYYDRSYHKNERYTL